MHYSATIDLRVVTTVAIAKKTTIPCVCYFTYQSFNLHLSAAIVLLLYGKRERNPSVIALQLLVLVVVIAFDHLNIPLQCLF